MERDPQEYTVPDGFEVKQQQQVLEKRVKK
jgi:hypothetical protein